MRNKITFNELKLHLLKGAVLLSGKDRKNFAETGWCKKVLSSIGYEKNDLLSDRTISSQGLEVIVSEHDAIGLVNFIQELRKEIFGVIVGSNSGLTTQDPGILEIDKVFALFQFALVDIKYLDNHARAKYHIPAFIYLINGLLGASNERVIVPPILQGDNDNLAKLLGCTVTALNNFTVLDLKKAYYKAALKVHPDKISDKEEEFKQLNTLYEKVAANKAKNGPSVPAESTCTLPKIKSETEISRLWVTAYRKNSSGFFKTYSKFSGMLSKALNVSSIDELVKKGLGVLTDKVWYRTKLLQMLTFSNLSISSFAALSFGSDSLSEAIFAMNNKGALKGFAGIFLLFAAYSASIPIYGVYKEKTSLSELLEESRGEGTWILAYINSCMPSLSMLVVPIFAIAGGGIPIKNLLPTEWSPMVYIAGFQLVANILLNSCIELRPNIVEQRQSL